MAHERARHLQAALRKTLALSPLVGVLGHRQVGKTTLLEALSDHYVSLDDPLTQGFLNRDVTHWLSRQAPPKARGLSALDECQTSPSLFPALKEWVRKHPRPGQFILSGSVRFTQRKAIRESLAGRILYHELLPMTLSELEREPLPRTAVQWLRARDLRGSENLLGAGRSTPERRKLMKEYLSKGGLPGLCFIRNDRLRREKFEDQLATLLDRDLRLVHATSVSFTDLRAILASVASSRGDIVRQTALRKVAGVSAPTLRKLMTAFEAIFLLRSVRIEGDRAGHCYFMEDLGEARHLTGAGLADPYWDPVHFLFTQLRAQWQYALEPPFEYFQYRTRAGVLVPLALRSEGDVLGFLPIESDRPNRSEARSADSFLKTYARSKVCFLAPGKREILGSRTALLDPLDLV